MGVSLSRRSKIIGVYAAMAVLGLVWLAGMGKLAKPGDPTVCLIRAGELYPMKQSGLPKGAAFTNCGPDGGTFSEDYMPGDAISGRP